LYVDPYNKARPKHGSLYWGLKMRHALGVILLFVVWSAQAATLLDTGAATADSYRCDAEDCGGSGEWTVMDDFTSSETWNVTGFSFRSNDPYNSGLTNYTSTTWEIWDADPFSNAAIYSGTASMSISSIGANWYEFSIDGLDIDLSAGTYWLGHHHDFSADEIFTALLTGDSGNYLQTDNGSYQSTLNGELSYQIRTSTVPVPAAVWLFGSALAGLGWFRRRA
jgi:hypothetical protein